MVRMALKDFKSRHDKKVSINVIPWATSTQIKRRQTGFAKPEDMAAIRFFQRDADYAGEQEMEMEMEEELDKRYDMELEEKKKKSVRAVSIVAGPKIEEVPKIHRRPTGYYPSEVIQRTLLDEQGQEDVDDDVTDSNIRRVSIDVGSIKNVKSKPISRRQTGYFSRDDFTTTSDKANTRSEKKTAVRIAAGYTEADEKESKSNYHFDTRQSVTRQSVLVRLLEDVADDDDEAPPKLKDYKPHETGKKQIKLAMSDSDINDNTLIRKSTRLLHRASDFESNEALQTVASIEMYDKPKMAMEYAGQGRPPIMRANRRNERRPTITVSQYKKMNEELRNEENKLQARKAEQEKKLQAQVSNKSPIGPPEDNEDVF